jgi:hypothetical protein
LPPILGWHLELLQKRKWKMTTQLKAPLVVAEIIIPSESTRSIMLQSWQMRGNQVEITAARYLPGEERCLHGLAWEEEDIEFLLLTPTELIRLKGRFTDARAQKTDHLRFHPWAKLENVQILERKAQEHRHIERYNRIVRQMERKLEAVRSIELN